MGLLCCNMVSIFNFWLFVSKRREKSHDCFEVLWENFHNIFVLGL
jgi:hypothetical protein